MVNYTIQATNPIDLCITPSSTEYFYEIDLPIALECL
jgi:hypothetical protein